MRAGMGAVVDYRQLRGGELGVALGGGEALVAQQFLNRAEVGTFFQQMCPEGVAQRVRMDVGREAAQDGDALDDAGDTARGEARFMTRLAETAQLEAHKKRGRRKSPAL